MIEDLIAMKESITAKVQECIEDIDGVNTKELGHAIDMIKDLAEAIYYCTITSSMNESSENDLESFKKKYLSSNSNELRLMYLENYADMLSSQVISMMQSANSEEKRTLQTHLQNLVNRLG